MYVSTLSHRQSKKTRCYREQNGHKPTRARPHTVANRHIFQVGPQSGFVSSSCSKSVSLWTIDTGFYRPDASTLLHTHTARKSGVTQTGRRRPLTRISMQTCLLVAHEQSGVTGTKFLTSRMSFLLQCHQPGLVHWTAFFLNLLTDSPGRADDPFTVTSSASTENCTRP